MDGKFTKEVTDFAGMDVKPKDDVSKADKEIAKWLKEHGLLFRTESYKHSYPHCWRCDSPLLNYATSSWFVAVESIKEKMLQVNADTQWVPGHIRDGRFGKWLEGARDWAISRNRYWGTPLPIWRCKETGELQVIGSRQDVMNQMPVRFTRVTVLRHGESEGNLIPIYQGKNPGTNLTANGKDQAASTGESLSTEKVTHIYYSPLARTKQTAEIIAKKTGAILIEDDRLREIEFGEYEGKTIDFSDLTFVKARRAHKLENNQVESIYHFPGMETWSHVQARMSAFLNEMLPKHRGDHVIVVTHADPLLSLKHFFTKEEPAKLCEQPYPRFAEPHTFYWDHDTNAEFDLHKETVDTISWPSSQHETSVDVTFVRHGETDWNKEKKIQGSNADNPLNDTGRIQAKECAQKLKGTSFDFIISSDLKRAVETAEILSKELGIPYTDKWSSLRERNLGDWSGQTRDSVHAAHPPLYPHSNVALHYLTPPNGESLSHYLKRAQQAHSEIIQKFPGKKILVVAHSGALQAFKILAGGESLEKASMMVPNGDAITMKLHPLVHRIPDVLDCWFESGSMPYAQSHYPFEKLSLTSEGDMTQKEAATGEQVESGKWKVESGKLKSELSTFNSQLSTKYSPLPPGFPADFIAEGIDQTRGWFYTLTVLSAALFEKPAFMNCIVNGTVLAEDGKKMSKRLKNYPEPLEIVEKYGADAIRFALMSSPAVRGEDLRFSAKYVEEQLRNVLLPFWNTYSFFVTYANAAKWEPQENRRHSTHPLDVWIRTEIQDLVNRMTHQLENYELSATCSELADTIDALTNWYVRLSRRRFAGKSAMHEMTASDGIHEDERSDALHTLYDVLLTLSQLLAPFCPFMSEAMYLNLVSEDHGSVHLTDWPKTRELTNSERVMLIRTRMLRSVVSLGLQIRSEKKIKVRQPLHKATVAIPLSILPKNALNSQELSLLREELNVKNVEIIDDPGSIAEVYVHVNARVAGPRLGGRVQDIIRAGKEGNFAVNDDGTISIMEERLTSDEASLMYRGREGEDVAANKGVVISLDTRITPELSLEGDARDIIRAIQQLRKDEGYHMQDRIVLYIEGADDIIQMHGDLVLNETNAHFGKNDGKPRKIDLDKRHVTITFAKV
jgi:isoleucyl-tRNA synthetase/phosphohistidine phosphatase SixA